VGNMERMGWLGELGSSGKGSLAMELRERVLFWRRTGCASARASAGGEVGLGAAGASRTRCSGGDWAVRSGETGLKSTGVRALFWGVCLPLRGGDWGDCEGPGDDGTLRSWGVAARLSRDSERRGCMRGSGGGVEVAGLGKRESPLGGCEDILAVIRVGY
jgi:hypothetical protein